MAESNKIIIQVPHSESFSQNDAEIEKTVQTLFEKFKKEGVNEVVVKMGPSKEQSLTAPQWEKSWSRAC